MSVDCVLYETDPSLASSRLEVRYDPEWLKTPAIPLLLYKDGMKVGEASHVNFQENSRVKRKGRGRPVYQHFLIVHPHLNDCILAGNGNFSLVLIPADTALKASTRPLWAESFCLP